MFAYKPLTREALESFVEEYNKVLGNLVERQKKEAKKPNLIDDVMAAMESDLKLQGATANEDKLQEDVPETIALLAEAGIKMYMLTGARCQCRELFRCRCHCRSVCLTRLSSVSLLVLAVTAVHGGVCRRQAGNCDQHRLRYADVVQRVHTDCVDIGGAAGLVLSPHMHRRCCLHLQLPHSRHGFTLCGTAYSAFFWRHFPLSSPSNLIVAPESS